MANYAKGQAPIPADAASHGPAWRPFGEDDGAPVLCTPLTLVEDINLGANISINGSEVTIGDAGGPGFQGTVDSVEDFQIDTNSLWLEYTVDSVVTQGDNGANIAAMGFGIKGWAGVVVGIDDGNVAFFEQRDLVAGDGVNLLHSDATLNPALPLTLQLQIDGDTGEVFFDYVGNAGAPIAITNSIAVGGVFPGIGAQAVNVQIFGGANVVPNTVVGTLNAGYALPVIDPPNDYVSYCNMVPPNIVEVVEDTGQFGLFGDNPDLDIQVSQGTYDITNISAGPSIEAWLRQSRYHYCSLPGDQLFVEMTINSYSDWSTDLFLQGTFYQGLFGGFDGIAMFPDIDGLGNGEIRDAANNLVWSGAVNLPWVAQLRMDSEGAITLEHSEDLGSPVSIQSFGQDIFHDQQVMFFHQAQLPAIANANMNFTINNGEQLTSIPLPPGYTSHQGKDKYLAAYRAFDFSSEGNTVIEGPYFGDSVFGRGIRMTKNALQVGTPPPIEPPEFTGSIGSAGLTAILDYPKSLYELHCTEKDAGMNERIVRLAANAVFDVQIEICYSDGFSGPDGVDNTPQAWALRVFDGIGSTLALLPLFNHVEFGLNDVIAMYYDNTFDSPDRIAVGAILNVGGEQIVYDPIECIPPTAGLTFTAIAELKTELNAPDGDTAKYEFNGIDADYHIKTYPDNLGLVDIQGQAIPLSVDPFTREALLAPHTHKDDSAASATVDVTKKIFTVDATGAAGPVRAFAHSPLNIKMETDGYIVEAELTTLTASATKEYFLELISPNNDEYIKVYPWFNGIDHDLVLETYSVNGAPTTVRQTIKASYVPAAGDRIAIFIETRLPIGGPTPNRFAVGILDDGINPVFTAQSLGGTFYLTGIPFADWQGQAFLPRMGHEAVPVGENMVMTSKLKSADMSANIKSWVSTNKPVGLTVRDIEGVVIP